MSRILHLSSPSVPQGMQSLSAIVAQHPPLLALRLIFVTLENPFFVAYPLPAGLPCKPANEPEQKIITRPWVG